MAFPDQSYAGAVEQVQATWWREQYQKSVKSALRGGAENRTVVAEYYGMNSANFRWAYGTPLDSPLGTVVH